MNTLMEHQRAGVAWLRQHPHAALLDEPGLGKTAQAVHAAEGDTLIVAPAMIHDAGVWADEVEKWRPDLDATLTSYHGICRKDGRRLLNAPRPELKKRWGTVILDESQKIKGRKVSWTSAIQKLEADNWILLSGTPIPNWAHEAFTQLQLIWPEKNRGGAELGSYWRWAAEWFDIEEEDHRGREHLSIKELREDRTWEEFRATNWGDRSLLRTREECLDLPPLTEQTFRVKLSVEQRRVYNALRKDFVAWLDDGSEIAAWNHADQFQKLAQITTQINGEGSKIRALQELLLDRAQPTLVVAHYRASVAAAQAGASAIGKVAATIDGSTPRNRRRELIRDFQAGRLDGLCATIDTIGLGLTLHAADLVIFLERSYVPSQNTQARDRIYRIGQERPVSAIHLIAENTLDERVLGLLKEKTDQQMEALPLSRVKELV